MKYYFFLLVVGVLGMAACGHNSGTATAPTGGTARITDPVAESTTMSDAKVEHTDEEWRKLLTPEQYRVLRLKGTERSFTGKYDEFFERGTYSCAACGQELFDSDTKFNSGCGWPAFFAAKAGDKVKITEDADGSGRMEVTCSRCGSHLGHVFDDAPKTPTGERFCINSVSLKFTPRGAGTQPKK